MNKRRKREREPSQARVGAEEAQLCFSVSQGGPPLLPGLEMGGGGSSEIAVSFSRGYRLFDIIFYFFLLSFIVCRCILFLTLFPV